MRRTRVRDLALACVLVSGAVFACNQIVGVTEVKLKKRDAGGEVPGDDDDGPVDPAEPIDSSVVQEPNLLTVALGERHSCVRKPDGTVKCWGDDSQGQTGSLGETADAGVVVSAVAVKSISDARAIAAGRQHTCVAHTTGKVSCWGYNLVGQLGNGESGSRSPAPVEVANINNAFRVAAGGDFSCAVRGASGTVACWGGNASGQLGSGNNTPSLGPVAVPGLTGVNAISAGQSHVCVVKTDGKVFCWGEGGNGQLGNGSTTASSSPVEVKSLPKSIAVAAGGRSTCALTDGGSVLCWGANDVGQLGSGAKNDNANPSPIDVLGFNDAVALAAGQNHTCVARKTGQVLCWGDGFRGQLGDDVARDAGAAQARAVPVANLADGFRVGAGAQHSCATTTSDKIVCWGAGDRGQLGNGAAASTRAPVGVTGL